MESTIIMKRTVRLSKAWLVAGFLVLVTVGLGQTRYSLRDLGVLGGNFSWATAINNSGTIVGVASTAQGMERAFRYDGQGMHDLGILSGGSYSEAFGLNSVGTVVGRGDLGGSHDPTVALYYDNSGLHILNIGDGASAALGVNDSGVIVGYEGGFIPTRAFSYDGSYHILPTLGGTENWAAAINNSGQIVGWSRIAGELRHAFLYDGTAHDLGSLGVESFASAINGLGEVVGSSLFADGTVHAFLYLNNSMLDLGMLPGMTDCRALGVNAAGQIVGNCAGPNGAYTSFIYFNSKMHDLNAMLDGTAAGYRVGAADGINDRGQIVGLAAKNGSTHAVLLTPKAQPISSTVRGGGG